MVPYLKTDEDWNVSINDVYALQEVKAENFGRYGAAIRKGMDGNYRYFGSTTGRSDRLLIIYDSDRLQLTEIREMFAYERHTSERLAASVTTHCPFPRRRKLTSSFLFVTVHLARGNEKLRTQQAAGLREWARDQTLPVVAIGDFNMDYDFATPRETRHLMRSSKMTYGGG